jgi:hypothetical protein
MVNGEFLRVEELPPGVNIACPESFNVLIQWHAVDASLNDKPVGRHGKHSLLGLRVGDTTSIRVKE